MAGGPITVTDRISVRVTAKNQEQSASQKRDVGGSIAKTLGNENVSDSLKDQLGNTKNPVITDENGDTWVSEEDIIDAGKTMNGEGAFGGTTTYRYGNVAAIPLSSLPLLGSFLADTYRPYGPIGVKPDGKSACLYAKRSNNNNDFAYDSVLQNYRVAGLRDISNNNLYLTFEGSNAIGNDIAVSSTDGRTGYSIALGPSTNPMISIENIPITDVGLVQSLSNYGSPVEETTGSSPIDWTKPDNEIDPQIHELFETMRTIDGKDYVKVAIATESGSGDSGSGGGHTGGDF